jgi:hypothetical protein
MFSAICAASSRVGLSTSIRHEAARRGLGSSERRCSEGSAKRRLAGAGLRQAQQVAALDQRRDRLALDRGGIE